MPDAPPGRHEEHASIEDAGFGIVPYLGTEDGGIQQERQAESGILDSHFNRD